MAACAAGGDRQDVHERIRQHSQAAAKRVKLEGADNDLLERLRGDDAFAGVPWKQVTDARRFTGRAAQQVDEFLSGFVAPIRKRYRAELARGVELEV